MWIRCFGLRVGEQVMNISNYSDSTDAIQYIIFGIISPVPSLTIFFKAKCGTKFTAAHICLQTVPTILPVHKTVWFGNYFSVFILMPVQNIIDRVFQRLATLKLTSRADEKFMQQNPCIKIQETYQRKDNDKFKKGGVAEPDRHQSEKLNPGPYQSETQDPDPDPHQSKKPDPDPHQRDSDSQSCRRGTSWGLQRLTMEPKWLTCGGYFVGRC